MNKYSKMKENQQNEFNAFPFGAAYSNKQFKEMMQKWDLTEKDTDKIYSIGSGCFIRKADAPVFDEMIERFDREKKQAIAADVNGDGFIYDMFICEMENHEFDYTGEIDETIEACGLTWQEVLDSPALKNGLTKALKRFGRSIDWYI